LGYLDPGCRDRNPAFGECEVKTVYFVLQVVLCSSLLQAQGKDTSQAVDTLRIHDFALTGPGIVPGKGMLFIPPLLQPEGIFDPFPEMYPGLPPDLLGAPILSKADLLTPYLLQLHRASQLNLYRIPSHQEVWVPPLKRRRYLPFPDVAGIRAAPARGPASPGPHYPENFQSPENP
jgi:hypothetical protein